MKQENYILSMIIPGPDSPGDAIDVYLQPLVEELLSYGKWASKHMMLLKGKILSYMQP